MANTTNSSAARDGVFFARLDNSATPLVDVTDFGATGDGTTDDYPSVQAAIDTMSAGDTLYFPPGDYFFETGWICCTSGMKIMGAGMYQTSILRGEGAGVDEGGYAQGVISVRTTKKGGSPTVPEPDNGNRVGIEICHLALDFNNAAYGWHYGRRLLMVGSYNASYYIKNLNIHHVRITNNDPTANPLTDSDTSGKDCWGLMSGNGVAENYQLQVCDCVHDAEWHQFMAIGSLGWNGAWVQRNYSYHSRDNGIGLGTNTTGIVSSSNVFITDNVIVGSPFNAIIFGADGGTNNSSPVTRNVVIANNTIIHDSFYEEAAASELYQCAITVHAPARGLDGLTITGNTQYVQDDAGSSEIWGCQVGSLNTPGEYETTAAFVQPAVGAEVEDIELYDVGTTDTPTVDRSVGNTLQIGDATTAGGRYEITAAASGVYTLLRRDWPSGTVANGSTEVPAGTKARMYSEVRGCSITGNSFASGSRLVRCVETEVSGNTFNMGTETNAMLTFSCYDTAIQNNIFRSGEIQIKYSGGGTISNNTFLDNPNSAGYLQFKSDPDTQGREPTHEWYVDGNVSTKIATNASSVVVFQSMAATAVHKLRGKIETAATPENVFYADKGTMATDVLAGALYIKTSDHTNKTGWSAL